MPGATGVFTSVHTDSREVQPGGLFFALKGSTQDGARFVPDAVARGAKGVVVIEPLAIDGVEMIVVDDPWRSLYDLAATRLSEAAPLVVGITGSNGKTSTKEMVAAILSTRFTVLKTEGNLNTETGVPLTILRLEPGVHDVIVLELGMQGPGEIARLTALARPRIGLVTGIGTVHIEFFDSREGIARAKGELLQALPHDGAAVLNADDPLTDLLRELSAAPVTTFGLEGGDYRGEGYSAGSFMVRGVPVRISLAGRHQARNAVAALAAGELAGVPLAEGAAAIASVTVERRLQALPAPGGFAVVDDAYNASPESMLAALETIGEIPHEGRLLAVLGEMRELGGLADGAHREVGRRAAEALDAFCVVDVGMGRLLAESGGGTLVPDRAAAAQWVRETARKGDLVLVKASHGVALETVVEELLAK